MEIWGLLLVIGYVRWREIEGGEIGVRKRQKEFRRCSLFWPWDLLFIRGPWAALNIPSWAQKRVFFICCASLFSVLRCTDRNLELRRNINETGSLRQSGDYRQSLEFRTAQCELGHQSVNPEALGGEQDDDHFTEEDAPMFILHLGWEEKNKTVSLKIS